ncbi:MAG: AraC family ligand binding domain-containing protein, partial [Planctomycetes bacterium]|nr:AraC family ligand binding domain-containing protein [Planctomycetota bacterium]
MAQDLGRAFHHRDHPHRQLHHHERELELNLVVRGRCRYLVDGVRLDLGPGHLLWLPPGRTHLLIDTGPDCALLVAMADLAGLRRRSPLAPHAAMAARTCLHAPARPLPRAAA